MKIVLINLSKYEIDKIFDISYSPGAQAILEFLKEKREKEDRKNAKEDKTRAPPGAEPDPQTAKGP